MSKGESCKKGDNSFYAQCTMCFIVGFPSMTKGEIVGIIGIDVKGLRLSLISYYDITIHIEFPRYIYIYNYKYIKKWVHVKK
jgi:hypothetical protein